MPSKPCLSPLQINFVGANTYVLRAAGWGCGSCRKPDGHSRPSPARPQPLLPSLLSPLNARWRMLEAQAGLTGVQVS